MRNIKLRAAVCASTGALAIGLAGMPAAAAAQDAVSSPTPEPDANEIVVTGSLLKGKDDDALALATVTADDLLKRGQLTTLDLVKSLPTVGATFAGDANPLGSSRVEGAASVNLRGLGNERTLVLLNGQRLAPITSGATTLVDLSVIPADVISRVEVLKSGGAATYGSDGVAGVVNFITRRDLEGIELRGSYTAIKNEDGDGHVSIQWGHKFNRGNVLIYAGWDHRSELRAVDRNFSNRPYLENPTGWTSQSVNPGIFYTFNTPAPGLKAITDPGCEAAGNMLTPLPAPVTSGSTRLCLQHYTNFSNLVDKQDRYQAYAQLNYALTDGINLSLTGGYTRTDVPDVSTNPGTFFVRFPTSTSTGTGLGRVSPFFYVPPTNPGLQDLLAKYSAAELGLSATQYGIVKAVGVNYLLNLVPYGIGGNPLFDYGAKQDYRYYNQYFGTGQLDGTLGSGDGAVDWRITGNYSVAKAHSSARDLLVSRVEYALRGLGGPGCDPTTGTPGVGSCQYLNVFSTGIASNAITGAANPGFVGHENTPELARWITSDGDIRSRNTLFSIEGLLSGAVPGIHLGGGLPRWAIGAQYRSAQSSVTPSEFLDVSQHPCIDEAAPLSACANDPRGPQGFFSAFAASNYTTKVYSTFAELQLPLLRTLEARLAGRYEKGPAGGTFNPNLAMRWNPLPWLTLRGSAGTTYRAPNEAQVNPDIGGVVALAVGATRIPFNRTGNPDLKPETSENYSAGAVIDAGDFHFSADWFRYVLKNQLTLEDGVSMVNTLLAGNCNNPAFADLKSRFTFNSNGCGAVADVVTVNTRWTNGPKVRMDGIDFSASYTFRDVAGANISLGGDLTYNIDFKVDPTVQFGTVLSGAYDAVGFYNSQRLPRTLPEWRGLAWINWSYGRHNLRLTYTYADSVRDERAGNGTLSDLLAPVPGYPAGTVVTNGSVIGSWQPTDIAYTWQMNDVLTLTASINNIFDLEPPLARTDLSYDAFVANPLQRTFRFGIRAKF